MKPCKPASMLSQHMHAPGHAWLCGTTSVAARDGIVVTFCACKMPWCLHACQKGVWNTYSPNHTLYAPLPPSMNAPVMVELNGESDPLEIAMMELREKKIPFTVRRYLPDGRCARRACFPTSCHVPQQ